MLGERGREETRLTLGLLLTIFAVGGAVAGCGDDGDGGDPLTKTEYLQQADAICAETNQQIFKLSETEFLGEEGASTIEQGIEQLRALAAPEGDEQPLDTVYVAADEGIDQLRAGPDADEDPFQRFHDLAAEYGFKQGCTENAG